MRTLEFISALKQNILELKINSKNHLLYVESDYSLLTEVKKFTYQYLNNSEGTLIKKDISQFLIDLLNRDNFNKRIKYSIVKLKEFGISKDKYYAFITESIKRFLEGKRGINYVNIDKYTDGVMDFNELVLDELTNCFRVWYFPRDIFYLDFSEKRQLLAKNHLTKSWDITNLGYYFLKLPTIKAISFLLAIEVVLNNDKEYSKFLHLGMIDKLLDKKQNKYQRFYGEPYSLKALGIIDNDNSKRQNQLTEFGKKIVKDIKDNYSQYENLILLLLESETSGLNFGEVSEIEKLDSWLNDSWILTSAQKESIKKAYTLYNSDSYYEGLNILYPRLEGVFNNALEKIGYDSSSKDFGGLSKKAVTLKNDKILTQKLSTFAQIIQSRNKILHGNIIDEDSEMLKPLFDLVLSYFKKVTREIEKNLKITNKV